MKRKLFFKFNKKKVLTLFIFVLLALIIIIFFVFLPFLVKASNSNISDIFIIDFQIENPIATIHLPARLTEFKQQREFVRVTLIEAPFLNGAEPMLAIRDLETLFPAKVEWNSVKRTIRILIPSGIISTKKLLFTLTEKDFIIKNNHAFVSTKKLAKLLQVSEIDWSFETRGFRFIWYI